MSGPQRRREIGVRRATCGWLGSFEAMGSPCEVLLDVDRESRARELAGVAAAEAWRIEDAYSRYLPDNIVSRINAAGGRPVGVDPETARLIDFSAHLFDLSDGRFDITSGVLRRVWTFDGGDRLPAPESVDKVLEQVGWDRVDWNGTSITLPAGMEIDFGGIGKEYAVDRAAGLLRERSDAGALVNFGGDLAVTAPPRDRRAWQVGIDAVSGVTTPGNTVISVAAGALATSGDSRRFLLSGGVRYGHILDPTTGWPVVGAPASVTVAADTCVQAGMLSTFAMLEGERAEAFLDAEGVRYWCERN